MVDSSVWIDYLRGIEDPRTELLDRLTSRVDVLVGDLVLLEVLQGIANDRDFLRVRHAMGQFPLVMLGGEEVAILAAQNFRRLRGQGITVRKTVDLLIATWCIQAGAELLHNDRDFDAFEKTLGLLVLRGRG